MLKIYLGHAPIFAKPFSGEKFFTYFMVSKHAVSSVLVKETARVQMPVFYVSKRLLYAELRYPELERLALALINSTRKLRHYFLAHPVVVFTNHPMKQVLRRPEVSGRVIKWAVELTQFDILYQPRTTIKGQVLVDFIAEFTFSSEEDRDRKWSPRSGSYTWMDPRTRTVWGPGSC